MTIAGLPLHPLVVHAAVVFTPLAAVLAILFAVVRRWRWATRWPTATTTVLALGAVFVAKLSGQALLRERPELRPLVVTHEQRGNILFLVMIGFTAVVAAAVWSLGGDSPLIGGGGARHSRVTGLERALPVVLVLAAVAVLVWVALTGDAGARAVYG
ncbi:MAG: DUF2231 domain-containing protein [Nocardioidaceae bacterium]